MSESSTVKQLLACERPRFVISDGTIGLSEFNWVLGVVLSQPKVVAKSNVTRQLVNQATYREGFTIPSMSSGIIRNSRSMQQFQIKYHYIEHVKTA